MALNYDTLIRAAGKSPNERTTAEINDFIFPWLKQSLKKKHGIFQKLSDDIIHDICRTIVLERRPAWDVVIHQGEPGDTFYIILQGSVNIYRSDEESSQPILPEFDPIQEFSKHDLDSDKREELIAQTFGNYIVTLVGGFDFGERALITNEPRSATVMTITPTDLLVLDREVFNRTLKAAHEKELQEKTDFINRCPLFSSWSPRLKRLVSLSIERERFSYDSVLYKQGALADAVYFIWSGEVKISMDPLLHWLQYPHLLPQSDPMKQRALETFQPSEKFNAPISYTSNLNSRRESYAIKRRYMTFAEAEQERTQRKLHLALLGTGDIVGLESYVCDLATYMNSARCTAACDLFYILKHNFLRLQKRHAIQGLNERLREMVLLSFQAYPSRVASLSIFTSLIKRQLAPPGNNEQLQYHNKQSWLLNLNNSSARRSGTAAYTSTKYSSMANSTNLSHETNRSQKILLRDATTVQYIKNDYIRIGKIEDRLKKWHEKMGNDTKIQIRPLSRYNITHTVTNNIIRTSSSDKLEAQSNSTIVPSSTCSGNDQSIVNIEELSALANTFNQSTPTNAISISSLSSKFNLPSISNRTKKERYEVLRTHFKQEWKNFVKRPIPAVY